MHHNNVNLNSILIERDPISLSEPFKNLSLRYIINKVCVIVTLQYLLRKKLANM